MRGVSTRNKCRPHDRYLVFYYSIVGEKTRMYVKEIIARLDMCNRKVVRHFRRTRSV